jgi:hypothetical protein
MRIDINRCPDAMQAEVAAWTSKYPMATAFIERLYEEQR